MSSLMVATRGHRGAPGTAGATWQYLPLGSHRGHRHHRDGRLHRARLQERESQHQRQRRAHAWESECSAITGAAARARSSTAPLPAAAGALPPAIGSASGSCIAQSALAARWAWRYLCAGIQLQSGNSNNADGNGDLPLRHQRQRAPAPDHHRGDAHLQRRSAAARRSSTSAPPRQAAALPAFVSNRPAGRQFQQLRDPTRCSVTTPTQRDPDAIDDGCHQLRALSRRSPTPAGNDYAYERPQHQHRLQRDRPAPAHHRGDRCRWCPGFWVTNV